MFLHHKRRRNRWSIEHVEWASTVDDPEDDASEVFTGNNPMYAHPAETVEEKRTQSRTLPAPHKKAFSFAPRRSRGGPSSSSPSRSTRANKFKTEGPSSYNPSRTVGRSSDEVYPYDSSLSANYARSTRRPVRAFQKLDEDVYEEFLHCTKKKPKGGRVVRRMPNLG